MNTLNEGTKGGLGVGLAILGCVLGVLGIYFGLAAQKEAKTSAMRTEEMSAQLGQLASDDQRMAFSIREVSDKADKLGQQITALEAKIPARPAPSTNRVSTVRSTGTTAATSQPGMYTIAAGDTLGKIAKSNNTTVDALQKANPSLDPKRLKIGASIKIP